MASDLDKKKFQIRRMDALYELDTASATALLTARNLAKEARSRTWYDELGIVTDRIRFYEPDDVQNIVFSAQSLVNRGMPFAARDLLRAALPAAEEATSEWYELLGLLGRCAKQIFLDSSDHSSTRARPYLEESITAYRTAYDKDPAKAYWHGGNIAGLLTIARSLGSPVTSETDPVAFSQGLKQVLAQVPDKDSWWHSTAVEAELGARNWAAAAECLKSFLDVARKEHQAFTVESHLRQLTDVWALGGPRSPPMVSAMLALLRAELLAWDEASAPIEVSAAEVASGIPATPELQQSRDDLQKTFGDSAPLNIDWWNLGNSRARSVAAICAPNEVGRPARMGTGFLVRLKKTGGGGDAGCFVLTNAHVIGNPGRASLPSINGASVRFEGHNPEKTFPIKRIVWTSPVSRHDATLLEIENCPADIDPIPVCRDLPDAASRSRLYVIGHPRGDALAFSFQDNRLLDHEGPEVGQPRQAGVVLVHYTTPTEVGSSGSPVFVQSEWKAVALHHSGSSETRQLNGKAGTYKANEGISLASISDALVQSKDLELCF